MHTIATLTDVVPVPVSRPVRVPLKQLPQPVPRDMTPDDTWTPEDLAELIREYHR